MLLWYSDEEDRPLGAQVKTNSRKLRPESRTKRKSGTKKKKIIGPIKPKEVGKESNLLIDLEDDLFESDYYSDDFAFLSPQ